MKQDYIFRLVITALFASIVCIFTMVIRIPTIGTSGYVNIGDSAVLLSAWILGGWYGAAAAGLGSAMADLFSGYPVYVPGTFVIKFLMGVTAYFLVRRNIKSGKRSVIMLVVSSIAAEILMIAGYFLYESIFLGYGIAAAASVSSNTIQGLTNLVLGLILIKMLEKTPLGSINADSFSRIE